jgi:hypothetical protein
MSAAQQVKKKSDEMQRAIEKSTDALAHNLDLIIDYAQKAPAFDVQDVLRTFSRSLYDTMASYDIDCKFTPGVPMLVSKEELEAMGHYKEPEAPSTPHRSTGFAAMFGAPPVNGKNGSAALNRNRVAPRVLFNPPGQREITNYMGNNRRGTKRARTTGGRRKGRRSSTRKCS